MSDYRAMIDGDVAPTSEMQVAIQWMAAEKYRETNDPYDWVPIQDAWMRYQWMKGTPPQLTKKLFGLAFHVAFPNAERCRRRRAKDGVSMRGWAGVTGPGAERSTDSDQWKRRR